MPRDFIRMVSNTKVSKRINIIYNLYEILNELDNIISIKNDITNLFQ